MVLTDFRISIYPRLKSNFLSFDFEHSNFDVISDLGGDLSLSETGHIAYIGDRTFETIYMAADRLIGFRCPSFALQASAGRKVFLWRRIRSTSDSAKLLDFFQEPADIRSYPNSSIFGLHFAGPRSLRCLAK